MCGRGVIHGWRARAWSGLMHAITAVLLLSSGLGHGPAQAADGQNPPAGVTLPPGLFHGTPAEIAAWFRSAADAIEASGPTEPCRWQVDERMVARCGCCGAFMTDGWNPGRKPEAHAPGCPEGRLEKVRWLRAQQQHYEARSRQPIARSHEPPSPPPPPAPDRKADVRERHEMIEELNRSLNQLARQLRRQEDARTARKNTEAIARADEILDAFNAQLRASIATATKRDAQSGFLSHPATPEFLSDFDAWMQSRAAESGSGEQWGRSDPGSASGMSGAQSRASTDIAGTAEEAARAIRELLTDNSAQVGVNAISNTQKLLGLRNRVLEIIRRIGREVEDAMTADPPAAAKRGGQGAQDSSVLQRINRHFQTSDPGSTHGLDPGRFDR